MAVLGVLQEQPARGNAVGPVQAEEAVHDTQVQEEAQMKKEFYEKVCEICGAEFIARHGNKRTCPTCTQVISRGEYQKAINRGYNVSEADLEKLMDDYKRTGKL